MADQLVATRRQELEVEDLEALWIEIKAKGSRSFLLCNVYRPPDVCLEQWTHRFESVLEKVNVDRNEVISMGDVNIDLSDNAKKCQCNNVFQDVMASFALEQLIMEPTRVTGTTFTLSDHVYVSDPHRIASSGILKLGLSDHYAVWAIHQNKWNLEHNSKTHKVIEHRTMKDCDPIGFQNDLTQMPLNNGLLFEDPNEALNFWYLIFTHVWDGHAPKTNKRVKSWW